MKYLNRKTIKGAVETSEGTILHRRHPAGFLCPARPDVINDDGVLSHRPPPPERNEDGKLIYALPGGGVWIP